MSEDKTAVDAIVDVSIDVERGLDRLKDTFRDRKFREAVELLNDEQKAELLSAVTTLSDALAARNTEFSALFENWEAFDAEREKQLAAEPEVPVAAAPELQPEPAFQPEPNVQNS